MSTDHWGGGTILNVIQGEIYLYTVNAYVHFKFAF